MKKNYLITAAILAGVSLVILFGFSRNKNQPYFPQVDPTRLLEAQTNSDGPVSVKITPKLSSEVAFEVMLDTHSEELDADLSQAAILKDENGREYKPLRWEGDPPGGHHREGTLVFGAIKPTPQTLQLTVRQVGGIAKREFLWTINP